MGNSTRFSCSYYSDFEQSECSEHQTPGPLLPDLIDFVSFKIFLNVSGLKFII